MNDSTTQSHRAAQIWSVLVFAARHQEIITYGTIDRLTGLNRNSLGIPLNLIASYCKRKNLPEIWSIVVNEETGFPGKKGMGEATELDILYKQHRVFAFNWHLKPYPCPRAKDFKTGAGT